MNLPAHLEGTILPPDVRCPLCSPDDEVGAVIASKDGLVACEGCRREANQGDRG